MRRRAKPGASRSDAGRCGAGRAPVDLGGFRRVFQDHQVIADTVEKISIAPRDSGGDVGDSAAVLKEHAVSQSLQASYIAFVAGESDLERADTVERARGWRLWRFVT